MIVDFPSIETADETGLLALGGDLEISSLELAYSRGIFPWPINDEYPLAWFSPNPRGVIFFDQLHISKSLKRILKKNDFTIKMNTNFEAVIEACASVPRKDQPGTWITEEIKEAYINLFNANKAYCVEAYNKEGSLVGGVYGVHFNQFVSGESMFFHESNASKVCLVHLIKYLQENGIKWLDTQMVTPVVESLGGVEIERSDFLILLNDVLN